MKETVAQVLLQVLLPALSAQRGESHTLPSMVHIRLASCKVTVLHRKWKYISSLNTQLKVATSSRADQLSDARPYEV